jgi:hypothetical protein
MYNDNDNKKHFKIFGSLSPSLSVEFSQDEEHVEIVLTVSSPYVNNVICLHFQQTIFLKTC